MRSSPMSSSRSRRRSRKSAFSSTLSKNAVPFPPPPPVPPHSSNGSNGTFIDNDDDDDDVYYDTDWDMEEEEEVDYYASGPPPASFGKSGTMRYVNVRVAIPAESPSIPEDCEDFCPPMDNVDLYCLPVTGAGNQQQLGGGSYRYASPMTVSSHASMSSLPPSSTSPVAARKSSKSMQQRSQSPYDFVPIQFIPNGNYNNGGSHSSAPPPHQFSYRSNTTTPTTPSSPHDAKKALSQSTLTISTESTAMETPVSLRSMVDSMGSPISIGTPPLYHHSNRGAATPSPTMHKHHHHLRKQQQQQQQHQRHRESPRPKTPNSHGRKSPFIHGAASPASLTSMENDEVRKTRIKTELCLHYKNGNPCPFGAKCTYAHGEEELQMTKLMHLHDAGLVDLESYRTRPCFSWVSTGACPFGKRCASIHDPRVQGAFPSWLTHTETQGNSIETDINVDGLFQKNQNQIHHGTPFGDQFSLEHDSWCDLYRKVCNLDYGANNGNQNFTKSSNGWKESHGNAHLRRRIPPLCKLKIALRMRGDSPDWQFKFQPQHVIYDELCMVLQKRAFRIKNNTRTTKLESGSYTVCDYEVREIPLTSYKSSNTNHVLVHELAFGPDSDPQVSRPVGLWFNIDEKRVAECSPDLSKRFRWKRGIKKDPSNKGQGRSTSAFGLGLENFALIRPHDEDAYRLSTQILEHRVAVLTNENNPNMKARFDRQKDLDQTKENLQQRFNDIRKQWVSWHWPVNFGREKVTRKTPVPSVDGRYQPPPLLVPFPDVNIPKDIVRQIQFDEDLSDGGDESLVIGTNVRRVWESFVVQEDLTGASSEKMQKDSKKKLPSTTYSRLPVFQHLQEGIELCDDRSLPHIRSSALANFLPQKEIKDKSPCATSLPRQQERCWSSLLLPCDGQAKLDEWSIVRDHFSNSRSKNVLDIIQA